MITEDYVSFEIAKLLKKKGFEEECSRFYMPNGNGRWKYEHYHDFDITERIECPTLQMAMKWFRKEHQIGIFPRQYHIYKDNAVSDEFGYGVEIIKLGTDIPLNPNGEKISDKDRYFISTSYEQACEAALKYSLENLI